MAFKRELLSRNNDRKEKVHKNNIQYLLIFNTKYKGVESIEEYCHTATSIFNIANNIFLQKYLPSFTSIRFLQADKLTGC